MWHSKLAVFETCYTNMNGLPTVFNAGCLLCTDDLGEIEEWREDPRVYQIFSEAGYAIRLFFLPRINKSCFSCLQSKGRPRDRVAWGAVASVRGWRRDRWKPEQRVGLLRSCCQAMWMASSPCSCLCLHAIPFSSLDLEPQIHQLSNKSSPQAGLGCVTGHLSQRTCWNHNPLPSPKRHYFTENPSALVYMLLSAPCHSLHIPTGLAATTKPCWWWHQTSTPWPHFGVVQGLRGGEAPWGQHGVLSGITEDYKWYYNVIIYDNNNINDKTLWVFPPSHAVRLGVKPRLRPEQPSHRRLSALPRFWSPKRGQKPKK